MVPRMDVMWKDSVSMFKREVCIVEAQIYNLPENYSRNVISRGDVCSSYTGLYLQMSIKLVRYVYDNCVAQCLSPVRGFQGWSTASGTD